MGTFILTSDGQWRWESLLLVFMWGDCVLIRQYVNIIKTSFQEWKICEGKERTFTPEVEKVWNKDYQCEYYRGVIIDGEDNIVERCTRTHASYDAALDEAKKKMAYSPLYYRQAGRRYKGKAGRV